MAECVQEEKEHAPYLVVDYGEQLAADFEDTRDELHKEILSVIEKLHLLWEIMRCTLVLVLPTLAGLGVVLFSQLILPRCLSTWAHTIILSVITAYVFLNLAPLCESVSTFLAKTYHSPKFVDCKCARCLLRQQSHDKAVGVATETEDGATEEGGAKGGEGGVDDCSAPEAGDMCYVGLRRREVTQLEEGEKDEGLHFEEVTVQEVKPKDSDNLISTE